MVCDLALDLLRNTLEIAIRKETVPHVLDAIFIKTAVPSQQRVNEWRKSFSYLKCFILLTANTSGRICRQNNIPVANNILIIYVIVSLAISTRRPSATGTRANGAAEDERLAATGQLRRPTGKIVVRCRYSTTKVTLVGRPGTRTHTRDQGHCGHE